MFFYISADSLLAENRTFFSKLNILEKTVKPTFKLIGSIYRQYCNYKKYIILCMQHSNSKKAEMIYITLGNILRTKRENLNKSQRILADEFDIQKSLISRLENGINEPKLVSIWTLCNALDIKISDLFKELENALPDDYSLIEK